MIREQNEFPTRIYPFNATEKKTIDGTEKCLFWKGGACNIQKIKSDLYKIAYLYSQIYLIRKIN